MELRQYQKNALWEIEHTFKTCNRQYIEMPTGSGKTFTFFNYAKKIDGNILIVVPSVELLNQVYENSLLFYHPLYVSRKGNRFDEEVKKVHIVIINSCNKKYVDYLSKLKFELMIIDEAHHSYSPSYQRLINSVNQCKILGVTATPDRLDGKFIDEILQKKSFSISIQELIQNKFLCDIEGYSIKTKIDISDIDDHNGDFSLSQLFKKLATEERNNMIVDIFKKEMKDRKTLIFCINVQHSKQIEKLLNDAGIIARHIDGKMNRIQRSTIISAFKKGQVQVITNCQVLTEGFDEPSIDGIMLARPTKSRGLFTQMIGRGLRISPQKLNCKIIDVVDNHKRLANYTCLMTDNEYIERIDNFDCFDNLKSHVSDCMMKLMETKIVRTDLLNYKLYDDLDCTENMEEYLRNNDIKFYLPLSLEEGSFLIWKNELKKRIG
jgi:superfamily II DNA or RNA helicase